MADTPNQSVDGFRPRILFPRAPATLLSQKLFLLGKPQHVSQRWTAAEVRNLVPTALQLERQLSTALGAVGAAFALGLVVGYIL